MSLIDGKILRPFFVLSHVALIGLSAWQSPLSLQSPVAVIFWVPVLISLSLYFYVGLLDPGYVKPLDLCSSTEGQPIVPNTHKISVVSTANPPTTLGSVFNLQKFDLNDLKSSREAGFYDENSRVDVSVGESSYCGEEFDNLPDDRIEEWRSIYFRYNCDVPEKPLPSSPSIDMSLADSPKKPEDLDFPINDDSIQQDQINDKPKTEEILLRYCTICQQDQPLRAKHCKYCNKCVYRSDHHCTWIANCVGERNHCQFYWYLFFQTSEGIIAIIFLGISIDDKEDAGNWVSANIGRIILIFVIGACIAFAIFLFCLQTYLWSRNLTTWELISWNKITYLKDRPKDKGSPFNFGFLGNFKYFCKFHSKPKVWKPIN
ncbi:unnamed protein product [Blepharisma stoltei]|uniref:Palmitoyltransferase n=1 Tax=Blepharisma stoltei TaxID=1481888 RepID=A0AAU9JIE1_9CILI|nr:unnamed protein product [Blepharisma stoltei]